MYPRRRIDIAWPQLLRAALFCVGAPSAKVLKRRLEALTPRSHSFMATLSVRTAFDLTLQALSLPQGSEVLLSAVTIRDMVTIVEAHGLVPRAVDLEFATLAPRLDLAEGVITDRTRVFVVAPLFGTRIEMERVSDFARKHNLFLIEDLAQAYAGDLSIAHAQSDVVMFSFGPIKTMTCLGGALLGLKDAALLARVRELELHLTTQTRFDFLKRILKFSALKILSWPTIYGLFTRLISLSGGDHDKLVGRLTRGFGDSSELLSKIRRRASRALVAFLLWRLRRPGREAVAQRQLRGQAALGELSTFAIPGRNNREHTFWVFPVCVANPERMVSELSRFGFDLTRGASNMVSVDQNAPAALGMLQSIVYLPIYPELPLAQFEQLIRQVRRCADLEGAKHEVSEQAWAN